MVRARRRFEGCRAIVELRRIPELYSGFPQRAAEGPTQYPVACSPQAWAAGSLLLLLGRAWA